MRVIKKIVKAVFFGFAMICLIFGGIIGFVPSIMVITGDASSDMFMIAMCADIAFLFGLAVLFSKTVLE